VVISEVRTRGAGGAADEFVELFNATAAPVTLGPTWKIQGRAAAGASYTDRWVGFSQVIPPWGHFLVAGLSYTQSPLNDDSLIAGLTDAGGLRLVKGTTVLDTVCLYYDAVTEAALNASFGCAGTPVSNLPHNNAGGAASNVDVSVERKPGGSLGNCTDTGDNASDFMTQAPATPMNTSSPPTP
jgi:hypothetical protein